MAAFPLSTRNITGYEKSKRSQGENKNLIRQAGFDGPFSQNHTGKGLFAEESFYATYQGPPGLYYSSNSNFPCAAICNDSFF
jgi:hypothetical protein